MAIVFGAAILANRVRFGGNFGVRPGSFCRSSSRTIRGRFRCRAAGGERGPVRDGYELAAESFFSAQFARKKFS
jgi:hypothetical protein